MWNLRPPMGSALEGYSTTFPWRTRLRHASLGASSIEGCVLKWCGPSVVCPFGSYSPAFCRGPRLDRFSRTSYFSRFKYLTVRMYVYAKVNRCINSKLCIVPFSQQKVCSRIKSTPNFKEGSQKVITSLLQYVRSYPSLLHVVYK